MTIKSLLPYQKSALGSFDIESSEEFKTSKYFCKTNFDMEKIRKEEQHYKDLPKIYNFANEKEEMLAKSNNFARINQEVETFVNQILGKSES